MEEALAEAGLEVEAQPEVDVPSHLLPDDAVAALVAERQPRFVAPGPPGTSLGDSERPAPDAATGVVQRRLSNGIKVNFRCTDNEPRAAMVRVVAAGGRSKEGAGAGPAGTGVVAVGTRTLSESGTVGSWAREQVGAVLPWVQLLSAPGPQARHADSLRLAGIGVGAFGSCASAAGADGGSS